MPTPDPSSPHPPALMHSIEDKRSVGAPLRDVSAWWVYRVLKGSLVPQSPTTKLVGFFYFSSHLKVYPFISLAYWGSKVGCKGFRGYRVRHREAFRSSTWGFGGAFGTNGG